MARSREYLGATMFDMAKYEAEKAKAESKPKPVSRAVRTDKTAKSLGWTLGKSNGRRTYQNEKAFPSKTQRVTITVDGKDSTITYAVFSSGRLVTSKTEPCRAVSRALKQTFPSSLRKGGRISTIPLTALGE